MWRIFWRRRVFPIAPEPSTPRDCDVCGTRDGHGPARECPTLAARRAESEYIQACIRTNGAYFPGDAPHAPRTP